MQLILEIVESVEFWMGLSLIAAALPGPQTRMLPALFRGVANVLSQSTKGRSG